MFWNVFPIPLFNPPQIMQVATMLLKIAFLKGVDVLRELQRICNEFPFP